MKAKSNRKRKMLLWLVPLVVVIALLGYYQLLYQSPRVDNGMATLARTFTGHGDIVMAVRFTHGDSLVVSGGVDSTVKIWKRESGEPIRTIKQPEGITSLDVTADGRFIVTGSYDAMTRIWQLEDGALLKNLKDHQGTVWTVAFSPDGKYVAGSGEDKTVTVWEAATGALVQRLKGPTLNVWAIKFSPDGTKIAAGGFDHSFKIWSISSGQLLMDNREHTQAIVDLDFSHDGKLLATTSDDKTIRLWNTANGKLVRMMNVPEHVQAVAFSPNDKRLLTGGRDKPMIGELLQNFFGDSHLNRGVSARLWEVQTGKLLQTFAQHFNDVNDVAYSSSGQWLATASADKTVEVWRVQY